MYSQKPIEEFSNLNIYRLSTAHIPEVYSLMQDVVSRLPNPDLFAWDDEESLYAYLEAGAEIYGACDGEKLIAYTLLSFPGLSDDNLGRQFEPALSNEDLLRTAVFDTSIVHESHRGKGLQQYFNRLRERRAKERRAICLYATVHPDNTVSRGNLEAAGLVHQFTQPMYGGKLRMCYMKFLEQ